MYDPLPISIEIPKHLKLFQIIYTEPDSVSKRDEFFWSESFENADKIAKKALKDIPYELSERPQWNSAKKS